MSPESKTTAGTMACTTGIRWVIWSLADMYVTVLQRVKLLIYSGLEAKLSFFFFFCIYYREQVCKNKHETNFRQNLMHFKLAMLSKWNHLKPVAYFYNRLSSHFLFHISGISDCWCLSPDFKDISEIFSSIWRSQNYVVT